MNVTAIYHDAERHLDQDFDIADGLAVELIDLGWTLPGCDDDIGLLANELRGHLMSGYGWDDEAKVTAWLRLHDEDFIHTEAYDIETPLTDPRIP